MTHNRLGRAPARLAIAAAGVLLPVITGCQAGLQPKLIVATVNAKPIMQQEYFDRVQRVQQTSFTGQAQGQDAGSVTLLNMINIELIDQCAAQPSLNALPSEGAVTAFYNQWLLKNPEDKSHVDAGIETKEDLMRSLRIRMELHAIGSDGAKPDDKELQAQYDKMNATHALEYPASYTFKAIIGKTREEAAAVIPDLLKSGDFAAAAVKLGASPEAAVSANHQNVIAGNRLPPAVTAALDKLTPNQYTTDPVEISVPTNPNNPTAPSNVYFVAQLISKTQAVSPKPAEAKEMLTEATIEEKFPQWNIHAAVEVAKFTQKSKIDIMIDRYKNLVSTVIMPGAKRDAEMGSTGLPGGTSGLVPPAGAGGAPQGGSPAPPVRR